LTLPASAEQWLADFSRGLLDLAQAHRTALIGGDTTCGPLTIAVQILGLTPSGSAIRRRGARPGDIVCLSGPVGDAAAGLKLVTGQGSDTPDADRSYLIERFVHPTPRVELGLLLRGIASAAIDVSDGLYADLGKLVTASGVGARLDIETLPLSEPLRRQFDPKTARDCALAGGDDYELCFTVPAAQMDKLRHSAQASGQVIHSIGHIEEHLGVRLYEAGRAVQIESQGQNKGYDHFGG
jgi:thiamine-monophosphate kinase